MELAIKDYTWDNTELLAETKAFATSYMTQIYSEETIADAKKDRTEIRKRREAIENRRKEIKAEYEKPLKEFERRVKEVTVILDEAEKHIKDQIDEVEEKRKADKMEAIKEVFAEVDYPFTIPLEAIFRSEWLNKSYSIKDVRLDMLDKQFDIKQHLAAIEKMEGSAEILEYYKETLNISDAMNAYDRAVNARKRAAEAQKPVEMPVERTEKTVKAAFVVEGTIPQLKALKAYMAVQGIKLLEG